MTDLTDASDRLPHEIEPAGAVQRSVCTWTRETNRNHTTSCGETWPNFIGLPKPDEPCPWCSRKRIIEAGQ